MRRWAAAIALGNTCEMRIAEPEHLASEPEHFPSEAEHFPHMAGVLKPSPFTPLGAKGVGEGNCMTTPVCLANAVCDALDVTDINLPLTPSKLSAIIHGEEAPRP